MKNIQLMDDENIIFSEQPERKLLSLSDIYIIPASLAFLVFGIGWLWTVIRISAPFLLIFLGVLLILAGCYVSFGRLIFKMNIKRRTYYFVTNQRIIHFRDGKKPKTLSMKIQSIPKIKKAIRKDGSGTLIFGDSSELHLFYGDTGLDIFIPSMQIKYDVIAFYGISNADVIYKTIEEIRSRKE